MAKNGDGPSKPTQQSTASGGSAVTQIDGSHNTVIQQQKKDGTVVGVYMPNVWDLDVIEPPPWSSSLPKDGYSDMRVFCVDFQARATIQPGASLMLVTVGKAGIDIPCLCELLSRQAGVVVSVHVAKGDIVKKGYLVARVRVWDER
jgi:hypothetical protein